MEPYNENKADDFIDKVVSETNYNKEYITDIVHYALYLGHLYEAIEAYDTNGISALIDFPLRMHNLYATDNSSFAEKEQLYFKRGEIND